MSRAVLLGTLLVSGLLHAGPSAVSHLRGPKEVLMVARVGIVPDVHTAGSRPQPGVLRRSSEAIRKDREALVNEAREARARDALRLGDFLLRAGALDAEELGYAVNVALARQKYEENLAALVAIKHSGVDIVTLLRERYGSFHYQSIGGSMVDALIDGGGSCEQITHLFAATMYDMGGLEEHAFVVYYGGGDRGHLAPIYRYGATDFDVVAGAKALPGGARFPAADLIEIYARRHKLVSALVDGPEGKSRAWSDGRASFGGGYPPNADAFDGAVPVFSPFALGRGVGAAVAGGGEFDMAASCMLTPRDMMDRNPVTIAHGGTSPRDNYDVEWRPTPSEADVAYAARWVARVERYLPKAKEAETLVLTTCLALAYEEMAIDFWLLSKRALSNVVMRRATKLRAAAKEMLRQTTWDDEKLEALNSQHDSWVLAFLVGSDDIVDRLLDMSFSWEGQMKMFRYSSSLVQIALKRDDDRAHRFFGRMVELEPTEQYQMTTVFMLDEELVPLLGRHYPSSDLYKGALAMQRLFKKLRERQLAGDLNIEDMRTAYDDAGFPPSWKEAVKASTER